MEEWRFCGSCLLGVLLLFDFVCGIIAIGLGSVIPIEIYLNFLEETPVLAISVLLIICGSASVIFAFLIFVRAGCVGCLDKLFNTNHCCWLFSFLSFIGGMAVFSLVAGIISYPVVDTAQIMTTNMEDSLKFYNPVENWGVSHTWNVLQRSSKCCGVHNYVDWFQVNNHLPIGSVPDSCCITPKADCGHNIITISSESIAEAIYTRGCLEDVVPGAEYLLRFIGTMGIVLGILQLASLVCILSLIQPIKKYYRNARDYEVILGIEPN